MIASSCKRLKFRRDRAWAEQNRYKITPQEALPIHSDVKKP
ncbi:hypothetical protein [Kovacikia minuta]|nr:hypothetical protein [Kovacikia minuta]